MTSVHSKGAGPFDGDGRGGDGASLEAVHLVGAQAATAENVEGRPRSPIVNCCPTRTLVDTLPSPGAATVSYLKVGFLSPW